MSPLETFRNSLPDEAKDTRINLQGIFQPGWSVLRDDQRNGVALSVAFSLGNKELIDCLLPLASGPVISDAKAAASLMAMNNVYYRFRHLVGKKVYSQKPARLRMQRLAQPATSKVDFELMCLAVSAVNGCGACMVAHEAVVLEGGLTEDHVHDAVRIAAVVNSAALVLV